MQAIPLSCGVQATESTELGRCPPVPEGTTRVGEGGGRGARMIRMVSGAVSSSAVAGARVWDVILGDRFIAALAAPAPDEVLTALAAAAGDDELALEALVGLIPSGRTDPIDSFGLVWWTGEDSSTGVTAVVRGDAVVDLASPGGSRRFDARGIQPWHLADFDDVVALRITDAASPLERAPGSGERITHRRASLRASSIEWAAVPETADAAAPATVEIAVADTIVTPRPSRSATGEAGPNPDAEPKREPEPTSPGEQRQTESIGARFRVGIGPPQTVTVPVLIGRRPVKPRIGASGPQPELLTVSSPGAVVSGTHLELRIVGSRLVATDLHSTNGTVLRTGSGARRLRAGESIVVLPGSSLDLGDGTIVEILFALGAPGA